MLQIMQKTTSKTFTILLSNEFLLPAFFPTEMWTNSNIYDCSQCNPSRLATNKKGETIFHVEKDFYRFLWKWKRSDGNEKKSFDSTKIFGRNFFSRFLMIKVFVFSPFSVLMIFCCCFSNIINKQAMAAITTNCGKL